MTAGNKNEYGDDSRKNRFTDPDTGEAYFLIIDKETGKTKIYNEEFGADKYVGEYDPDTGKIKYNRNLWGGANKKDKAFINNQINNGGIKNQAQKVIARELMAGEKNADGEQVKDPVAANREASRLMDQVVTEADAEGTGNTEVDSGDNTGTRKGAFVYPDTLRDGFQDTIKFTKIKYRTSGFDSESSSVNQAGTRETIKETAHILGIVILPIPAQIKSDNSTNWTEGKMTVKDSIMANMVMEAGKNASVASGLEPLRKAVDKADDPGVRTALIASLAQAATGNPDVLTRDTGQVLNPNMEMLFRGPQLRKFSFSFQLTPRNEREGKRILQIIRFFKQGMAPIRASGNLFLKTPDVFNLEYTHNGGDHKGLNRFKECALVSCGVNYTPSGNYSTYEDGIMTGYKMDLTFNELEPIYNDNYGSNEGGNIPEELGF